MADDDTQCAGKVWSRYERRFYRCPNRGRAPRGGKLYCGHHDPEAVAARDAARAAAREAAWRERRQAADARHDRERAAADFLAGVATGSLRALVAAGYRLSDVLAVCGDALEAMAECADGDTPTSAALRRVVESVEPADGKGGEGR